MEDKLFAGLHAGLLVHRLSLMAGTEVLATSPAHWKVTAIDDACVACIDVTVQHPCPYMVEHLDACTGPQVTTKVRVRKAALGGMECVMASPTHPPPEGQRAPACPRDAKGERLLEAYARLACILDTHESSPAAGGVSHRLKLIYHCLM